MALCEVVDQFTYLKTFEVYDLFYLFEHKLKIGWHQWHIADNWQHHHLLVKEYDQNLLNIFLENNLHDDRYEKEGHSGCGCLIHTLNKLLFRLIFVKLPWDVSHKFESAIDLKDFLT